MNKLIRITLFLGGCLHIYKRTLKE